MWRWIVIFALFVSNAAKAQHAPRPCVIVTPGGDTLGHVITEKDSLKLYKDIRKIAGRSKVTLWLYKFVFNDPQRNSVKPVAVTKKDSIQVKPDDYTGYDRAVIRRIEIRTLDPFGTSVTDSTKRTNNLLKISANRLHIKSTRMTIRNQLLFRKGQRLDPLVIRENERILRQSTYVRDANIRIVPVNSNRDTVDVIVTVQDKWSLGGSVGLSTGTSKLLVTEKNFMGLGHQLKTNFYYNIPDNTNYRFNGSYTVPYIRNTFITGSAFYSHSQTYFMRGVSFDRPFYSPLAKWSYGVSAMRENTAQSFALNDTSYIQFPLDYHRQDAWMGRSFQLVEGRSVAKRSTKLVTALRCINMQYLRRAPFEFDTLRLNQDMLFTLGSIGFSNQRYYKDINIYKFGEAEYVPEGRLLEFTGGYRSKEFDHHYYGGIRAGIGNHVSNIGYVSGLIGYGTFFNNRVLQDGVLNIDVSYFSDSWRWNKWTGRQFLFLRSATGYNRERPERITLNNERALYGFRSDMVSGYKKVTLNAVSVAYIPYTVVGFRFAAIAFAGFGMVGSKSSIWDNPVYQAYGVGLLVRNDHLVFSTFMLSFGIYPNVPDKGLAYRFNPISTYNFGFHDFLMSRPDVIPYR
jgi:hypothetical protein